MIKDKIICPECEGVGETKICVSNRCVYDKWPVYCVVHKRRCVNYLPSNLGLVDMCELCNGEGFLYWIDEMFK